ncbi:SRPBCC family protein [Solicola gregarius]|uniref:SRPBCC family protein n=1 Tax=Solicola gregarius TaxID=2908642 RepID=A0AA46YM39_9ACTN|nr:SRPBCC family protein [Solicola gregarius]UYM07302.1 SRPBCC family protein [Solicola gregarius]
MTETTDSTAVRLDIEVDVPRKRAFQVFTEQFDRIKPREHNLLAVDIAETVFETRVGGQVYDRGVDGSECRWADVLAYEPPQRFVIGWLISPQWQLETDPGRRSEVEVNFTEIAPSRTRVDLVHRHLERHGAGWESAHSALESGGGWPLYLQRYLDVVTEEW